MCKGIPTAEKKSHIQLASLKPFAAMNSKRYLKKVVQDIRQALDDLESSEE